MSMGEISDIEVIKVICINTSGPTWVTGQPDSLNVKIGSVYTIRYLFHGSHNKSPRISLSYFVFEFNDYYPSDCFQLIDEYRNSKLESIGI